MMTGSKYALAIGDIADGLVFTGLWDSEIEAIEAGSMLRRAKPWCVVEIVPHDMNLQRRSPRDRDTPTTASRAALAKLGDGYSLQMVLRK